MSVERRLIGRLWDCGDPDCACVQPVIEEEVTSGTGFTSERLWEGDFFSDPSPSELEFAHDQLAEAAARHGLEPDGFETNVYERIL